MELVGKNSLSRLRLSSKRLESGKVQVKFHVSTKTAGKRYGYLLTEPKASLRDVVAAIIESYNYDTTIGFQRHLFSIGKERQMTDMVIYK